jgi:hypothetical protein
MVKFENMTALDPSAFDMSLGATGRFDLALLRNVTSYLNGFNENEKTITRLTKYSFEGMVQYTSASVLSGVTVGIILIRYKDGATVSTTEQTNNENSLTDYLTVACSSDFDYKIMALSSVPSHIGETNSGYSTFLNAYKLKFTYIPPKYSQEKAAEAGISSNENIFEPKYITAFYAFVMQRTNVARNGGIIGREILSYTEKERNLQKMKI